MNSALHGQLAFLEVFLYKFMSHPQFFCLAFHLPLDFLRFGTKTSSSTGSQSKGVFHMGWHKVMQENSTVRARAFLSPLFLIFNVLYSDLQQERNDNSKYLWNRKGNDLFSLLTKLAWESTWPLTFPWNHKLLPSWERFNRFARTINWMPLSHWGSSTRSARSRYPALMRAG